MDPCRWATPPDDLFFVTLYSGRYVSKPCRARWLTARFSCRASVYATYHLLGRGSSVGIAGAMAGVMAAIRGLTSHCIILFPCYSLHGKDPVSGPFVSALSIEADTFVFEMCN